MVEWPAEVTLTSTVSYTTVDILWRGAVGERSDVAYHNGHCLLKLLVIHGNSLMLLGRDWLAALNAQLQELSVMHT